MARPPHFLTSMVTSAGTWHLVAGRLARPIATRIEGAFDAQSRRRGLLGRTGLAEGDALVLMPSGAVHTFGMQFAIDVVYAKRDGRVIKLRRSMVRNRLSAALGAFAVIELPAGTIERTGLAVGDQLQLRASDGPEAART